MTTATIANPALTPLSLRLLCERRTCRECGTHFTAPALEPRVVCENHRGEQFAISIADYQRIVTQEEKLKWFGVSRLPRETLVVEVPIAHCINCFTEGEEKTQRKREAFNDYRKMWSFYLHGEPKGNLSPETSLEKRALLYSSPSKRKKQKQKNARKPYVASTDEFK